MRIEKGAVGGAGGGNFLEHQVQQGDTLESIAGKYSTTKQALQQANRHITGETLKLGQVLQIPQPKLARSTNNLEDTIEPFDDSKTAFFASSEHGQIPKEIPTFAPPYVPVGPVTPPSLGDNVAKINLAVNQFQINEEGNLVINNPDLIQFFKNLTESAPANQNIQVAITKLEPSEE